jgi:putative transposase
MRYAAAMETRALAHIYRLDPTPAQRGALARLVGCRRFVYNWALARRRDHDRATGTYLSTATLGTALTQLKRDPEHRWLAEVDSQALQQALRDLERSYANFFAGRAERPAFASKHGGDQTARIPQRVGVDEATNTVRIPKVGHIRLHLSRPLVGVVKSATMRRDRCGDWYVALRLEAPALVDAPVPAEQARANAVGLDLGLTTYATLSDGEAIANPRHLRSRQRALRRANRAHARKQQGSANREQSRKRLAKLHRKVARQRADFQHKLTTGLVRRYDLLCVEALNVAGLARTKLARSMHDAAHGELLRQLRYKAAWHGKHFVAVDQWYPSSKTCGTCGHVYADLALGERVWTCAACGVTHDRDANAARTILTEGTRLFHLRLAGDERAGVPPVRVGAGLARRRGRGRGRGPVGSTGLATGSGGSTTIPTPTPSSRRDTPRRETPVDDASDAAPVAQRRVKQEAHTLEGWEVST